MSRFSGDVLFLCQTSLHYLLVPALSRLWDGEKVVVWVRESDVDARLVDQVSRVSGFTFISLPGGARIQNKFLRMITRSLNVFRLRFFQPQIRGQSLVVFNDLSPETQYLINSFHSHGGRVYLGEDGVATYPTGGVVPAGAASRVLGKILYGIWWLPKPKIGLNDKVSAVFASYPHLIRGDVAKGKEVLQLPLLEVQDFNDSFDLGLEGYLLCVMPLVLSVTDEGLKRFVDALRGCGHKLAIKFHPREDDVGRGRVEARLGARDYCVIPKETPIEAVCARSLGLKEVVGYRSSALHLLSFFKPGLKVMYVEFADGGPSEVWRCFFKKVGVVDFFEAYSFSG